MDPPPLTPNAVRALGTIRREALAAARQHLDDALRRLSAIRPRLDDPGDEDTLRGDVRAAIGVLRALDAELAAHADPGTRQAGDRERVRSAAGRRDGPARE